MLNEITTVEFGSTRNTTQNEIKMSHFVHIDI